MNSIQIEPHRQLSPSPQRQENQEVNHEQHPVPKAFDEEFQHSIQTDADATKMKLDLKSSQGQMESTPPAQVTQISEKDFKNQQKIYSNAKLIFCALIVAFFSSVISLSAGYAILRYNLVTINVVYSGGSYNFGVGNQEQKEVTAAVSPLKQNPSKSEPTVSQINAKLIEIQRQFDQLESKFIVLKAAWQSETIKKTWFEEIKKNVLENIQYKGLKIGNRWVIQEETIFFVVRDLLSSSNGWDSRLAFRAGRSANV